MCLPSGFILEIEDWVTITSTMTHDDVETFAGSYAALITNDHDGGNYGATVRGCHIDCTDSILDSITVENVGWPYGVVLHDYEHSRMIDCVGYNIGCDASGSTAVPNISTSSTVRTTTIPTGRTSRQPDPATTSTSGSVT